NVNSLKFRDHYRCHCFFGDKACDDLTGECEGACDRGWFGPACQYKTCPFKGAPLWLTDDNDYTCNDESDQSLKVKLATRLAFTWLRIVVRFPANKRRSLVRTIRKRQATFLGHVMRRGKLEHLVTTGKFEGKRSRGRQREKIMDGLATWLGPGKVSDILAAVKDRDLWRDMIANTYKQGT
ncbi:UDP-glucuronosyltransferase 2a1-like, partial [Plakobranchus ocellatus]